MSSRSDSLEFGGEVHLTDGNKDLEGTKQWPDMGTGRSASEGWGRAAYHRDMSYHSRDAGDPSYWFDSNFPLDPSTKSDCYTADYQSSERIFYFGGRGCNAAHTTRIV